MKRLSQEQERRPLVAGRVCRLLSLVPDLAVDTKDYAVFSEEVIKMLWQSTQDNNPLVRCAAYEALACFPPDSFRASFLPDQFTQELRQQAQQVVQEASKSDEGSEEVAPTDIDKVLDDQFPQVPATVYTAMLKSIKKGDTVSLKGMQTFLCAMVKHESTNLPRGVFFSSRSNTTIASSSTSSGGSGKRPAVGSSVNTVEKIPSLLQQMYEKSKAGSELRHNLAVGLLFCYNPPVETGRDGRQFVMRHSKLFQQTFGQLLQEVSVDSTDWQLCRSLPRAWNVFMKRLFNAVMEGRRAQLDALGKQGNLSSADVTAEISLAWLWARDAIVDGIRTGSRGSPAAEANCVLALAGLAVCVQDHANSLDPAAMENAESQESKFMGHSRWQIVAVDTILSLVDVEYKPRSGLFGLCQQRSTLDRAPPSMACRSAARVAASQLVPILMATDAHSDGVMKGTDIILQLLADFSKVVSSVGDPDEDVWQGLSLGMLLERLFEENFSQTTGTKGMLAVWKALTSLEKACLTSATEIGSASETTKSPSAGASCALGLALALCGLCAQGRTESRVHVVSTLEKMTEFLRSTSMENPLYEVLCLAVIRVAAAVHASNSSSEDVATSLLQTVQEAHVKLPQSTSISISLGLLSSTLSKLGDREAGQLLQKKTETWLQNINNQEMERKSRLSQLHGLLAMLASETVVSRVNSGATSNKTSLSNMINVVSKVMTSTEESDLQKAAAWLLGCLHLSSSSDLVSKSNVPTSYSYLPETSFLRAIVDFLVENGSTGSSACHLCTAMHALNTEQPLPPLDWESLFSPFMKSSCGETLMTLCLQISANQITGSSSAAFFVSAWLTPPLFYSLPMNSQAVLHRNMPRVIRSVSPAIIKLYLERSCDPAFSDLSHYLATLSHATSTAQQPSTVSKSKTAKDPTDFQGKVEKRKDTPVYLVLSILAGLRDCLSIDDPPASVTLLLHEATGRFYQMLPTGAGDILSTPVLDVLHGMAECLEHVPDDVLDSIISEDFMDSSTQSKGSYVRCSLVAAGCQPVSLLNVVIDAAFNLPDWNQTMGSYLLNHCLAIMPADSKKKGSTFNHGERLQWMSELLGHTRSIATGAWPLAEYTLPLNKIIHFLISTVASSFLAFASVISDEMVSWGIDIDMFKKSHDKELCDIDVASEMVDKAVEEGRFEGLTISPAKYLPTAVPAMTTDTCATIMSKLVDWLLTILHLDHTSDADRKTLNDALLSLRYTKEFAHSSVWSKVIKA